MEFFNNFADVYVAIEVMVMCLGLGLFLKAGMLSFKRIFYCILLGLVWPLALIWGTFNCITEEIEDCNRNRGE